MIELVKTIALLCQFQIATGAKYEADNAKALLACQKYYIVCTRKSKLDECVIGREVK